MELVAIHSRKSSALCRSASHSICVRANVGHRASSKQPVADAIEKRAGTVVLDQTMPQRKYLYQAHGSDSDIDTGIGNRPLTPSRPTTSRMNIRRKGPARIRTSVPRKHHGIGKGVYGNGTTSEVATQAKLHDRLGAFVPQQFARPIRFLVKRTGSIGGKSTGGQLHRAWLVEQAQATAGNIVRTRDLRGGHD